jgi:hypothetical protein
MKLASQIRAGIVREMCEARGDWLLTEGGVEWDGRTLKDGTVTMTSWVQDGHGKWHKGKVRRFRISVSEE